MPLEFLARLSNNFNKLLDNADDYDVTVKVGKGTDIRLFNAHSVILRAQSEYFRAGLSSKWAKKEGGKFVFEKPNITPTVFESLLRYIYSGTILVEELSGDEVMALLVAADELVMDELIGPLQVHIIRDKAQYVQSNLRRILGTVMQLSACERLKEHCLMTLCPSPRWFFEAEEFVSIDEKTVTWLLGRDDLCLKEGEIWDYMIRWGIANTSTLKPKISDWGVKEFWSLKKTLHRCLPLIRYWQISLVDFHEKVKPFEKILPRELKTPLSRHFMKDKDRKDKVVSKRASPPTKLIQRSIDSNIISTEQAALISSWIDRKSITNGTNGRSTSPSPYIFRLLFRGSRDGFSAKTFHRQCDNQGPTVVVVRVDDSKEVLGGYNPIDWSSPPKVEWRATTDSFIFSLGDGKDPKTVRLSRIKMDCVKDAIQLHDGLGPSFGFYELKIIDEAHECRSSYGTGGLRYENKIRDKCNYFGVDDYEVFQVVRRVVKPIDVVAS